VPISRLGDIRNKQIATRHATQVCAIKTPLVMKWRRAFSGQLQDQVAAQPGDHVCRLAGEKQGSVAVLVGADIGSGALGPRDTALIDRRSAGGGAGIDGGAADEKAMSWRRAAVVGELSDLSVRSVNVSRCGSDDRGARNVPYEIVALG